MSVWGELKRRNVVRVAAAYAIVAWLVIEVAATTFPILRLPDWSVTLVTVLLFIGFPVALTFAWVYELTPEGVKRERDVDRSRSITRVTGRKLDRVIIVTLVVALAYFVWERQFPDEPAAPVETADETVVTSADEILNPEPDSRSIAVLPFLNMSTDAEQEWFSDGLTEEILNALARTPDLLVASRTSSFKFKGSTEDIQAIAAALGVAHVLEGSVRRARDRLRVTAQLIRASDGFHLWSQTYDRNLEDVIAIQEDVAVEIATALDTAMDPDALEQMVSAGTNSVEAYNAYLKGLAYGVSTLNTGDRYLFLSARDAFDKAVELDPTFAYAYWELAKFWRIQGSTTNIIAGTVEMPIDEIRALFEDSISKAIEHERDPVSKTKFRVLRELEHLRLVEALRLNTEYLTQRPLDQYAQNLQLELLGQLQKDEELRDAIEEFQRRDGYDLIVSQASMTASLISDDKKFIRDFAIVAMQRVGDSPFAMYQAHRALLWAGDIDGASAMARVLKTSELPEASRLLVEFRQACAEGRLADAARVDERLRTNYPDEVSMIWISHRLMNRVDDAIVELKAFDDSGDLRSLKGFLNYAYFDARDYPNLVALLKSQGITPREPRQIPYRCKRT